MLDKTCDVVTFDDVEYDLRDKEDVIDLFNELVYEIKSLRREVNELRTDTNFIQTHYDCSYNFEEE